VEHSPRHTVIFTVLLCAVFSVVVSAVAVSLHDRQVENQRLDRIRKVLGVAGLVRADEKLEDAEAVARFESGLEARVIDVGTGQPVEGVDPLSYDQRKAAKDPARSHAVPENRAKVRRVPDQVVVYLIKAGEDVAGVVIPIEGYGLWSTLYGYLALERDGRTVRGITYYEHGETPELGGEVDNPNWKARWPGRLAYDDDFEPALRVKKGLAGSPQEDPYQVDGLSGATITSGGVTNMLAFWLGPRGFGPYLAEFRKAHANGGAG